MIKLKDTLKEYKQVGIIYHYTVFDNALEMLKNDNFKASDTADSTKKNPKYGISFTRDKKFHDNHSVSFRESSFGREPQLRFVFDGNKLSDRYKINPWSQGGPFSKNKKSFESEERIVQKELFSIPIKKYLISVDILVDYEKLKKKRDIDSQIKYDDYLVHYMAPRAEIIEFANKNNIIINLIVDKNGNVMSNKNKESFFKKMLNWWNNIND